MGIKEKISYLKRLRHALLISTNLNKKYSLNEINDFISLGLLPPTPIYKEARRKKCTLIKENNFKMKGGMVK